MKISIGNEGCGSASNGVHGKSWVYNNIYLYIIHTHTTQMCML